MTVTNMVVVAIIVVTAPQNEAISPWTAAGSTLTGAGGAPRAGGALLLPPRPPDDVGGFALGTGPSPSSS